ALRLALALAFRGDAPGAAPVRWPIAGQWPATRSAQQAGQESLESTPLSAPGSPGGRKTSISKGDKTMRERRLSARGRRARRILAAACLAGLAWVGCRAQGAPAASAPSPSSRAASSAPIPAERFF